MNVDDLAERTNEPLGGTAGVQHVPTRRGEVATERQLIVDEGDRERVVGPIRLTDRDLAFGKSSECQGLDGREIDSALGRHGLARRFDGSWSH